MNWFNSFWLLNWQVISDDESGVTVTVPQPADAALSVTENADVSMDAPASAVVCVVEVPAVADAANWPESPRPDGSDSEPELGTSE